MPFPLCALTPDAWPSSQAEAEWDTCRMRAENRTVITFAAVPGPAPGFGLAGLVAGSYGGVRVSAPPEAP